jgi:DNA invertase Pin-like site-specific DNA recombinase
MENNKVAIYCRLSVEDMDKIEKGDDSESIQNQKLLLMDYAMNQGWSIHKVYSDDDYSGLNRNRPEFNKMITDAENGQFNIILCKTQSRFTRDMEMVEKYIHGLFVIWGIRFVSVVDNVDTNVKGNKKARQIYGLINEWYCEDLSENIRAVFKQKMLDGQFLGSFAAFGYKKDPLNRHKLIIDEEAAKTVKKIYDMYLQGLGSQQIAKTLMIMDIPTPTEYKQMNGSSFANPNAAKYSVNHGVWSHNTIRRILQNKVYIGTLIQGRERKVSYKSSKVIIAPKEEWVVIENNHEPIVDRKTFLTVQELMTGRRITHQPKTGYKGTAEAHLLAGKVRCADCQTIMTRSAPARNGRHYLRCKLAYKTKNNDQVCTPHTIILEKLIKIVEDRVRKLINDYLSDSDEIAVLTEYCFKRDDLKQQITIKEKELSAVKARYTELTKVITDAYIDKTKGILTEADFMGIKERLNDEITKVTSKQANIENIIEDIRVKMNSLRNADEVLQNYISFDTLTHTMVNDFIDYVEVFNRNPAGEQKIVIHWLF